MSEENKEFSCDGIVYDDYKNVEEAGEYCGRLVGKRWGKKKNLITNLRNIDGDTFTSFDDVIIRRLVECIRVKPDKTIEVILKGGMHDTIKCE